jgi:hypothetical protein
MSDIKEKIKLNPVVYVYKIEKKEFKLIFNTDSKKEAKEQIYKMKDYKCVFAIIKLTFHNDDKLYLKASLDFYKLNNKNVLENLGNTEPYSNMSGPVWFSKKFLEKYNWNNKYLDNIVKKVIGGKVELSLIGKTYYEVEFK